MRYTGLILLLALPTLALAEATTPAPTRAALDALVDAPVDGWTWKLGEVDGAEQPGFDDSAWQPVRLGFTWLPHESTGWFRKRVTIPETIGGIPARGKQVRMTVSVDNGAKAYVDGVFKQKFEWAKGDFVLTDHAEPGQTVVVALHAVNHPGTGGLLRAQLVCTPDEPLSKGLGDLLKYLDYALFDSAYVPADEAAHWQDVSAQALQQLDMLAYRAGQTAVFLRSLDAAQTTLLQDGETLEASLAQTAAQLAQIKAGIAKARETGAGMDYARLDARVIESFLQYVRDDWAEPVVPKKIRALKGAAYIARLAADALSQDSAGGKVKRYQTARANIGQGAFWQEGQPFYYVGVGHFGQVRQDLPILNEYGLNIIQIEMGPAEVMKDLDTIDVERIRNNLVPVLDRAAANNVAVNLLISTHYFPEWAYDLDPELRRCGLPKAFLQCCIESPITQQVMDRWLDALVPVVAHHPALHSICLSNEPQFKGRCAHCRAKFQEWMKEKHGSVEAANRFYGTAYARFEDVELPKDAHQYAIFFDWCRFNQERFLAFHERLRDKIHQYDAELPVHAKVMSHGFEDPGRFEVGIDYERFSQLDRIAGNDCVVAFNDHRRGDYKMDWVNMAMSYALQRAAAPESPIFNSENHFIGDGDARYMSEDYIHTVYWLEALHGQGATTAWVWERGQTGDFAENILTRAPAVRGLGRAALDLNRLAPEVLAVANAPADIAILYGYSSLLRNTDFVTAAKAAYEGAYFTGAACDLVTERKAAAGGLDRYKLVVVPNAANAPEAVVDAFQRFIENGGTVVTIGECFVNDEYNRPREKRLESRGKGQLVAYPAPLSARACREVLDALLDRTGCARPLRIEGTHGEPVWGVNLRVAPDPKHQDRLLASLLNLSWEPVTVQFREPERPASVVNLIDGKPVEALLTLEPLQPVLLACEGAGIAGH